MSDRQPEGTFSRLMASTTQAPEKTAQEPSSLTPPVNEEPEEKQVHARTGTRTHAPKHTSIHRRTHTSTEAQVHASLEEALFHKLQLKQRLASSTFRFQPEELKELDEVFDKLEQKNSRKVSKNDLVRLSLNWLLTDYRTNGENSLLVRVLAHS